ncbi:MAG: fructose-6-phosphate aldolase [Myxococcales bacterium]|nr:fructose-6-phosphate aldolase [Myxococcales bacterium]
MKFFLDTADIDEIRRASAWGILDGVTTNPSLVAKTGRRFDDVKAEILDLVKGPVSLEVTATDYDGMMTQARALAAEGEQVVVKIPLTQAGIQATATCTKEGIKTNVTLCFSANQALVAAKAGATYISPFVGRLDDIGNPGMEVVADILEVYKNFNFETQVLAASLRHPAHVLDAARLGAHVATMPIKVIEQLFKHPMTDIGLARFMADWQKVPE